jgi:hypothetical protein
MEVQGDQSRDDADRDLCPVVLVHRSLPPAISDKGRLRTPSCRNRRSNERDCALYADPLQIVAIGLRGPSRCDSHHVLALSRLGSKRIGSPRMTVEIWSRRTCSVTSAAAPSPRRSRHRACLQSGQPDLLHRDIPSHGIDSVCANRNLDPKGIVAFESGMRLISQRPTVHPCPSIRRGRTDGNFDLGRRRGRAYRSPARVAAADDHRALHVSPPPAAILHRAYRLRFDCSWRGKHARKAAVASTGAPFRYRLRECGRAHQCNGHESDRRPYRRREQQSCLLH